MSTRRRRNRQRPVTSSNRDTIVDRTMYGARDLSGRWRMCNETSVSSQLPSNYERMRATVKPMDRHVASDITARSVLADRRRTAALPPPGSHRRHAAQSRPIGCCNRDDAVNEDVIVTEGELLRQTSTCYIEIETCCDRFASSFATRIVSFE